MKIYPEVQKTIDRVLLLEISRERKEILAPFINYVQAKVDAGKRVNLNFICTHNSRRSQFAQIWAQTAAVYYGVKATCNSGGIEVTAFNERAIASIQRSGFKALSIGKDNPHVKVTFAEYVPPVLAFSKRYDHPTNGTEKFAAIMTCSDADENCPIIPKAEERIAVNYEDPKAFDNTAMEEAKYDERSLQIASEMFYVFSNITLND